MTASSHQTGLRQTIIKGPVTYLLGALVSLPIMSMTLIAPAIPMVRTEFEVSYNVAQLIVTAFLLAMAVGLLFVGLLSDRFGRRPLFLLGAWLFFIGALAGYFATDIVILVIARALQGLGAAALMTTGRIIANDIFDAKDASRALSSVTAVQSIVPVLALAVGGLIVEAFGWRATMAVMAIFSLIVIAQSALLLPETNHNKLKSLRFSALFEAYQTVLCSHMWHLYSIAAGMQIGMFYSMNGYMSYHFARLGASVTEFGFYYATISFGYLIGNLFNRRFGYRFSLGQWVYYGSYITLFALIAIWLIDSGDWLTPWLLSLLLSVVGFSHGLLVANAIISSIQNMGSHSGSASGIGSAAHMMIGALAGSLIISLGGATSFAICMIVNIIMALICLLAAFAGLRKNNKTV